MEKTLDGMEREESVIAPVTLAFVKSIPSWTYQSTLDGSWNQAESLLKHFLTQLFSVVP
jgi:hypothetical protein